MPAAKNTRIGSKRPSSRRGMWSMMYRLSAISSAAIDRALATMPATNQPTLPTDIRPAAATASVMPAEKT